MPYNIIATKNGQSEVIDTCEGLELAQFLANEYRVELGKEYIVKFKLVVSSEEQSNE